MRYLVRLATLSSLVALSTWAANTPIDFGPDPEDFTIEVTGSIWTRDSKGSLFDAHTNLDLLNDLGAAQDVNTFFGKLAFKPTYHQRILIEGTPLSLHGYHDSVESFVYGGQRFTLNEPLTTSASLSYVFAGYEYDFLCGRRGHLGASIGGAYMNASGTVSATAAGVSGTRSQRIGLPLAGIEFRVFPIRDHPWLAIDGRMKGMDFGSYGHYVDANLNVGVWMKGRIGVQAGYRYITTLLEENGRLNAGLELRLTGPIFSVSFKR
jgi:hypothetical protein